MNHPATLARLRRVRRGVRVALGLGVAASLAANVLHAEPNFVARVISAWPPIALIVTVELISRVPVSSRWLTVVRVGGTALVAVIAGWVSYWHMVAVATRYGETTDAAHLIPLTADGMIVVASACLFDLGRHIRAAEVGAGGDGPEIAEDGRPDLRPEDQDGPELDQDEDGNHRDDTEREDGHPRTAPAPIPVQPGPDTGREIARDGDQDRPGEDQDEDGRPEDDEDGDRDGDERPTDEEVAAARTYAAQCAAENRRLTRDGLKRELRISSEVASALLRNLNGTAP